VVRFSHQNASARAADSSRSSAATTSLLSVHSRGTFSLSPFHVVLFAVSLLCVSRSPRVYRTHNTHTHTHVRTLLSVSTPLLPYQRLVSAEPTPHNACIASGRSLWILNSEWRFAAAVRARRQAFVRPFETRGKNAPRNRHESFTRPFIWYPVLSAAQQKRTGGFRTDCPRQPDANGRFERISKTLCWKHPTTLYICTPIITWSYTHDDV